MGDRSGSLLELLIRINRDVAGALELRTVLQRLIMAAVQHVGGERASIMVLDEMGRPVDAAIVHGSNLHEHTTQQLRETLDRGLAGWVIRNREPVLVPDTSKDERWLRRPDDAADRSGAKCAVCVPLLARNQVVGVLTIVHPVPGTFTSEHLELAHAIADQASIAVLNARLYGESSRQARIMTALAQSAASFGASLNMQEVWERILDRTIQTLQVETAAIGLQEEADKQLVFHAAAGTHAENIAGHRIAAGGGLIGEVLRTGRAMGLSNVARDPRYTERDLLPGVETRAILLGPIQSQGRPIGVLEAINPLSGRFDADAVTVMQGLAGLAGTTIHNAHLFEQLQEAQRHYLELFEESIDLILVTDWQGRITETNRQAETVTGIPAEQLRAMNIEQLLPVNLDKMGKGFAALRRQPAPPYESALQTVGGRPVTVEVHARRIEFAATDSILWTLHDMTESKQLEQLRQNLAAMIYHDLRSPLSNLISSLDLLEGMIGDHPTARSTLEIAEHSAGRMSRLVNSLLDIDKLEAGQALTARSMQRPEELVKDAVREVGPSAEAGQHALSIVLAPPLPEIWVDGGMMRRVLINLLENALKFSNAGTAIEIGAEQKGESLEFWVKDHGPGIPASDRQRIFEKFGHLSRGPTAVSGLGLGLAFCQMAVRAHEGTIRVESEEAHGSKFIVTLPVKIPGV